MMKAVGYNKYLPIDQQDSLIDVVIPKPSPDGRDILVEVKAISVNPADPIVRAYDIKFGEPPYILGWTLQVLSIKLDRTVRFLNRGMKCFMQEVSQDPDVTANFI